ncbi:MAG: hypothetical protein QXI58_01675 [Candidatus Micrarchaeia archaeon]
MTEIKKKFLISFFFLLFCGSLDEGIDFIDIITLDKIGEDSTVQSFSSILNSSFFKTAYYFGTLKTKNLVEIKSEIGKSAVSRTNFGNEILKTAKERASEPLDELDYAILRAIAGNKDYEKVKEEVNVFSTDLGFHMYKLYSQGYINYNINDLDVDLSLTENGFKIVGFVPKIEKRREKKIEKEKVEEQKEKIKEIKEMEESRIEEEIYSEKDVTSSLPEGGGKLSRSKMFLEKFSFYFKKYLPFIILLVILICVVFFFLVKI